MALVVQYIPEPEWFHNHNLIQSEGSSLTSEELNEKGEKGSSIIKHRKILITGIITALGKITSQLP